MDVTQYMTEGYAFTCAMCSKLWRSKQQGNDKCEAGMKGLTCNGPMVGSDFPLYEGPLTNESRMSLCFRCGQESDFGVKMAAGNKILGVCKQHMDEFSVWRRSSKPRDYRTLEQNKIETKQ